MARVVAFVPDLLFGSRVLAAVREAGHDPVLVSDADALRGALPGADAVVADLTVDPEERIAVVADAAGVPVLAFYSHVEAEVRTRALAAGFALVVPRSRMAREGSALVVRLLAPDDRPEEDGPSA